MLDMVYCTGTVHYGTVPPCTRVFRDLDSLYRVPDTRYLYSISGVPEDYAFLHFPELRFRLDGLDVEQLGWSVLELPAAQWFTVLVCLFTVWVGFPQSVGILPFLV